tara:strand:+ start:1386 stop:2243 length:858 start_codon:yes stop_codon:yes gene_type:complete
MGQNAADLGESNIYRLQGEGMELAIDGNVGARAVSFKLDGTEIFGSRALHPNSYGSTLWLGPQGKWKGHKVLDASPYSLGSYNQRELRLLSGNDSLNGFTVSKYFRLNTPDSSIAIRYTITNISKKNQEVAPWEVTRVPTGGLALFPKGIPTDIPSGHRGLPYLKIKDSLGIIWYPYDRSTNSREKLFMYGSEGWLAYVRDGILFIKKFPEIDPSEAAPGEKNVEVFVNKEKTYIELENQGIYKSLPSGASLTYSVKWYARRLPHGLRPEIGNMDLVEYIRKVVE